MREHGAVLGGEQSGHVIALDRQTTGDGLDHGRRCCSAALDRADHEPLAEAADARAHASRRCSSTSAPNRDAARRTARAVWELVERESAPLDGQRAPGRIVLRSSGTEPLVRVMVEHEDAEELRSALRSLVSEVERELGIA